MNPEEAIKEYLENLGKLEDLQKEVLLKLKIMERITIRNGEIEKLLEANG